MTSLTVPKETFEHALGLQRAGDDVSAEALYLKILAQDPSHAHAIHGLGSIAFARQQYSEALMLFRRAATILPQEGVFLCNLGSALQACGWLSEALDALRSAVRISPEFIGGWRNLLTVLEALELGQSEEARQAQGHITELTTSIVNECNERGLRLAREQRLDEACDAFISGIRASPEEATLYHNLGNALLLRGRLDESVSCLVQAIKLEPNSAEAYRSLGNTLRLKGDICGAIRAYEHALVTQPSMHDVGHDLVALQRMLFDGQATAIIGHAAGQPQPLELNMLCPLASVLYRLGHLTESLAYYEKACALSPLDSALREGRRLVLQALENKNSDVSSGVE